MKFIIKNGLLKDGVFKIAGFGTFRVLFKKERLGMNPKTKIKYPINKRKVVTFSPSKIVKKKLNSLGTKLRTKTIRPERSSNSCGNLLSDFERLIRKNRLVTNHVRRQFVQKDHRIPQAISFLTSDDPENSSGEKSRTKTTRPERSSDWSGNCFSDVGRSIRKIRQVKITLEGNSSRKIIRSIKQSRF